jgi:Rab11 family-interacting protein 3/4
MDMVSVSDAELHTGIGEISAQVNKIQEALSSLEENQMDDKHVRLKQDNAVLQERIHVLEETLQSTEERWKEKFADERSRYKEQLGHAERERNLETETLSLKLQLLEREHSECTTSKQKLESEITALSNENAGMEERISVLELQLGDLTRDQDDASGLLKTTRQKAEQQLREREAIIEELQEEVERLRAANANRSRSGSIAERSSELEEEVTHLRGEQRRLKEVNEELHAQLVQASVEEGRNLLNGMANVPSLADEMDSMSKDQLMESLKDQEIVNQKLRAYIDGILLRIMEMYPAILEVQH